ncbi:ComEA family DNA-binding protein [Rufibacter hautae]|uniref:Helix-hairpin-helix domain-containing protein n=1 Tax=Rufibacter hautae TaxID=2595005 RepID=A0A5B6T8T3_9BACT|nr:helix-hairpin-helix domain-containing protein [Rufibacter hautae]KAA3436568.1 helix-hairpin-helix domain-containing protein [Rufibacter hautae]
MKYGFWLIFLMIGLKQVAAGQEIPRPPVDVELLVQELFAQQDDENSVAYEDLYETLLQYYRQPLDLNRASREELRSLWLLSEGQISALLQHIQENGRLLSLYELQSVPGFDLISIRRLLPFVTVQSLGQIGQRSWQERLKNADNHSLLLRYDRTVQERRGYTPPEGRSTTRYLGSPDKFLLRYRLSHPRDFSFGVTAEKDAGESFTWNPGQRVYGFDFLSAHAQLYDRGAFKTIALGDYQLQFGQGLLLSSGFSVGKGGETITTIRRSQLGIRPHTSTLEANFFRGAAATHRWKRLETTLFYSNRRVDASAGDVPAEDSTTATLGGLQTSGLHRTPTELANRQRAWEQVMGANVTYRNPTQTFSLGFTGLHTMFDLALQPRPEPYNLFTFSGTRNMVAGLHYSYLWQNLNFFGETALSGTGGLGTVNGLLASLSEKVEVSLLYRYYARDFQTLYGAAFGEGSRNQNESGLYTGLKVRLSDRWQLTGYYDRFSFPWLRYRVDAPSDGEEYLLRLQFMPSKTTLLYGQYQYERKARNETVESESLRQVTDTNAHRFLLLLDVSPLPSLRLRSRVQASRFRQSGPVRTGFFAAQDVSWEYNNTRLSARYALFDTDDYDTRLYAPEQDVLYGFSIPAFAGQGTRVYLLAQQRLTRHLDAWFKLSHTHYRGQSTIGSGLEQIQGPQRTDVRLQVRYRF